MYLVEENAVPAFADDARKDDLPSLDEIHGIDYVQVDPDTYEPKSKTGIPTLPERFRFFFEKGAVTTRVVEVMPDGTVILDKGRSDGLKPGLVLANVGGESAGEIDIVELTQTTAIGRPIYYNENGTKVRKGHKFTTGSRWTRPAGSGRKRLSTLQSPGASKNR
jgi:hypothetical protein